MPRKHGQSIYFIEGEGFVGEQDTGELLPAASPAPEGTRSASPSIASSQRAFRFSRLFPDLPAFRPDPDILITLGQAMDDSVNHKDHPDLPAGYTYFGQFLDHDITFDKTDGLPDSILTPEEIEQGRSPSLDLDNVYGRGPGLESKRLYEDDGIHLRIGHTTGFDGPFGTPEDRSLPNDLPRGDNPDNLLEATIGDPRNDENLSVAQLHLAFLKFHNVVVAQLAESGLSGSELFEQARRVVCLHYQWIVLYDYLPRVIDPMILAQVIEDGPQFFKNEPGEEPTMPVEFSVAAYRFGHSMIRDTYSWNRNFGSAGLSELFVFSGVSGDMGGNPTLPSNWPIDWSRFFDCKDALDVPPSPELNKTRSIDTALALTLQELPEFSGAGVKASLAVRNLLRGRSIGLPTGQAVAEAVGAPVMHPSQIRQGQHEQALRAGGFDRETPLWYYILKEAEIFTNGQRLGPVGSRLLAETFVGLILGSRNSILGGTNRHWRPTLPSLRPGHFCMADLILLVNDINPLVGEISQLPPPPPENRIHVVRPGESLRSIALLHLGDANLWRVIFNANRDQLSNPNVISVGMELVIPNL